MMTRTLLSTAVLATTLAVPAQADNVVNDDQIVIGSLCVGFDCSNGINFGFDTIRMMENNTRIKFDDTSNTSSFPRNDWQLTANESNNGGDEKFSIDDITGGRIPFTIEAGARTNALYVEDSGELGLGTDSPATDIDITTGDTPTVRLRQDGTSGFTPQTWDIAGNETNFFIRDATFGSKLVFRIEPDSPRNSIYVDSTGNIGMGTNSPDDALNLERSSGAIAIRLTSGAATAPNPLRLNFNTNQNEFRITYDGLGLNQLRLDSAGNLTVSGDINSDGTTVVPDYVFADDYALMPLHEVEAFIHENRHLPRIPSAQEVAAEGLNMTEMQMALLEKVEELTLYTLQQQKLIDALQAQLATR